MTQMHLSSSPPAGESRRVDAVMVKTAMARLARPIACRAGPPPMGAALREVLVAAGIGEDDIRAEEFFGY